MILFFCAMRKLFTADNRLIAVFLGLEKPYMNGNTIGIVRCAGIYRSNGCAAAAIPDFGRRTLADVKEDALFLVYINCAFSHCPPKLRQRSTIGILTQLRPSQARSGGQANSGLALPQRVGDEFSAQVMAQIFCRQPEPQNSTATAGLEEIFSSLFTPADSLSYNHFFIVFQIEFFAEGRVIKIAADNIVQAFGGAIQSDILIG